jgi:hypothetical protein
MVPLVKFYNWAGKPLFRNLAWFLDITIYNATIPSDWKGTIMVPVYKGGDRLIDIEYRPVTCLFLSESKWST